MEQGGIEVYRGAVQLRRVAYCTIFMQDKTVHEN